jgi:hypothetical protein
MLNYMTIQFPHLVFHPTHAAVPLFKLLLNPLMPQVTFPLSNYWFNTPFVPTVPFAIPPAMPCGAANTNKSAKSYQGIGS